MLVHHSKMSVAIGNETGTNLRTVGNDDKRKGTRSVQVSRQSHVMDGMEWGWGWSRRRDPYQLVGHYVTEGVARYLEGRTGPESANEWNEYLDTIISTALLSVGQ